MRMRNVFYISIGISLAIVVAAVAHYRWRTHQLREPLARVSDVAVPQESSQVNPPVPFHAVPTSITHPSETTGAPVKNRPLSDAQEAEFDEIMAKYERMNKAYEKREAEHEARIAEMHRGREGIQRRIAEMDAEIAMLEAKRALMPEVDASYSDMGLPPAVVKAMEAAAANEESIKRIEAQYGSIDAFAEHVIRTHMPEVFSAIE